MALFQVVVIGGKIVISALNVTIILPAAVSVREEQEGLLREGIDLVQIGSIDEGVEVLESINFDTAGTMKKKIGTFFRGSWGDIKNLTWGWRFLWLSVVLSGLAITLYILSMFWGLIVLSVMAMAWGLVIYFATWLLAPGVHKKWPYVSTKMAEVNQKVFRLVKGSIERHEAAKSLEQERVEIRLSKSSSQKVWQRGRILRKKAVRASTGLRDALHAKCGISEKDDPVVEFVTYIWGIMKPILTKIRLVGSAVISVFTRKKTNASDSKMVAGTPKVDSSDEA